MSHAALLVLFLLLLPLSLGAQTEKDMRLRAIRVGVMLPLNDKSVEGRHMVEYYRGVLMACDSLRQHGVSVDIHAWDVTSDTDIATIVNKPGAADCDLIIGPLYSRHLKPLADFAKENGIRLLVPFSINAADIVADPLVYQVYQPAEDFNKRAIELYREMFASYHTVIIDCNDSTSRKGTFTLGLRSRLEQLGRSFRITNIKSPEEAFTKAFSTTSPNMVVVNTGRMQDLTLVFAKLNNLTVNNPDLSVSMFGYSEWLSYTQYNLDNYYRYNVYIPSTFYYNPLSAKTSRFQQKYRWNFHADMENALPRFGLSGFDHAYFFIRGLSLLGERFTGRGPAVGYTALQTPLDFEQDGEGGRKNRALMMVHYTPGHKIDTMTY